MTSPHLDDPTEHWGLIFHGSGRYTPSHNRQDWAQIADAIRAADLLHADLLHAGRSTASGDVVPVRGDDLWCRTAVDTFTRLHDAGAYWHLRPGDEPHCHADEHLIRAWLDAPWVPPTETEQTMAQVTGWDLTFAPDRAAIDPSSLTILVDLAQNAGVFGAPQHKITLLTWVQDGITRDDEFLVLLWPPDEPARGSGPVGIDRLVQPDRAPVDTIVGVLQGAATVANQLLGHPTRHQQGTPRPPRLAVVEPPPVPAHVEGWRLGDPARAFPPLHLVQPTTTCSEPPTAPPPARPGPHR